MTPAPGTVALLPAVALAPCPAATSARAPVRRAPPSPVALLADVAQFAALVGRQLAACRHYGVRHAVILVEIELSERADNRVDAGVQAQLHEAAGARLRARVRDTDCVARFGDWRFGVLLVDAAKADLNAVQARLHKAVCGHYGIEGRLLHVIGRLGAAMYPSGGSTGPELVRTAEMALALSTPESPWVKPEQRLQALAP